ncbi:hypothetical protein Tco_0386161 [Tanacetum coccineum]
MGHWYPKDSPFDLVAYTDSDYAGASLDRKSTTGGCQFLGCRLISWQCKKQTVVANSTIEAEYVAASSCCGQVFWIQNQLLDYGYNFMHTKIFIDNNRKAKKSVKLMIEKLFRMELELMLAKIINGEEQLHALVDGKKIIIIESSVRRDLQLADEEGVDCLPNSTIFEQLTLIGSFLETLEKGRKGSLEVVSTLFLTMMVQAQEEMGEGSANPTDPHHTPTIIQPSTSQPQKKQKPRKPKRKDTEVPQPSGPTDNVTDEAVYEEMDDNLERVAATATSLDAEQDRGNINKTQSKATLNEPSSIGTSSGSGPMCQDTMGDTIAQIGFENVSKTSKDSLLARVGRSARMVSSDDASLGDQEDASKQGRKIDDIDKDAVITLIDETQGRYGDDLMFDTCVLDDEKVFAGQDMAEKEINVAEKEVSTADLVTTAGEVVTTTTLTETTTADDLTNLTLAQTLREVRSAKSKVKRVVIGEQSESTTRTRP